MPPETGPEEAGQLLNVDYLASGSVRRAGKRLMVEVELTETRTSRIVWTERFDRTLDDAFLILNEIGDSIVAAIAGEIETLERNRAILKPPNSLDAWEAYHRGLWHMYRFDKADNEQARHFFEMALRLDPTFARAYAGLSFTHGQNAFQGWAARNPEIERAYDLAEQSLMADDRDPAAHWAMGRALWLRRRPVFRVLIRLSDRKAEWIQRGTEKVSLPGLPGGGGSHLRTRLTPKFPGNREKAGNFPQILATGGF